MISFSLVTPEGDKTIGGITTKEEVDWALNELKKRALKGLGVKE